MKIKIVAFTLCIAILFTTITFIPKAEAKLGIFDFNVTEMLGYVADYGTWSSTLGTWVGKMADKAYEAITAQALLFNKVAALLAVQATTKLVVGEGDGGTIIRDFNHYLYISPQQRAMAQMNSFFNTVSRGRLSSLNYEGIGPNYDAYLVAQARMAIGGQAFTTNIQDSVTNPKQLFSGGNMKGIMNYMQCANNVACYTLTSTAQYNKEFAKAQEIAKTENVGGFTPKKTNGRIVQPAALAQSALLQLDQLGTQIIMNAEGGDSEDDISATQQVWIGAGISTAARLTNYGISDSAGRDAIRNKNDEFPFSLAYNLNTGMSISSGGFSFKTGAGALSLQTRIGNTCVSAGGTIDIGGATVDIDGRKIARIDGKEYDCE
ncbi:MAG: hypothetical protein ACD_9C00289G0001, partial [uncultured bacterium]